MSTVDLKSNIEKAVKTSTLNLESFNDILMKAFPKEKHKELIEVELYTAYKMKICEMENLIDLLNLTHGKRPTQTAWNEISKQLQRINNIDSNCNALEEMLEMFKDGE